MNDEEMRRGWKALADYFKISERKARSLKGSLRLAARPFSCELAILQGGCLLLAIRNPQVGQAKGLKGPKTNLDTDRSREKIKMIHILAKHGAKWLPEDRSEILEARRSLAKMRPDYTVEFIWIMAKYNACKPEDLEELLRAPALKSLVSKHAARISELLRSFKSADQGTTQPSEGRIEPST